MINDISRERKRERLSGREERDSEKNMTEGERVKGKTGKRGKEGELIGKLEVGRRGRELGNELYCGSVSIK